MPANSLLMVIWSEYVGTANCGVQSGNVCVQPADYREGQIAERTAESGSAKDVGRVVDSAIEAGNAYYCGPYEYHRGQLTGAHDAR